MPKRLPISAPIFALGMDLNNSKNLKTGQISSGAAARVVRGTGIMTGPGFRSVATPGTGAVYPFEGVVFSLTWVKAGTKVKYSLDPETGTFYDSGLSLTSAEIGAFVEQGNGDIFVFNQTDSSVRIAVAQVTSVVTATDTAITVGADWVTKFDATNPSTVYINGTAYVYTGISGTQLTGFPSLPAFPVGTYIIQTSTPTTFTGTLPVKGTFGFEFESRMIIGGRLHFENQLYASAPADITNPQYFYDFQGNGTVAHFFQGKMTAGIKGIGKAFVFSDRQTQQLDSFDVTTGAFLTSPISEKYGAYNPRCVVDMEGIIAFFGQKRIIPITLQLSPTGASSPFLGEEFDVPLRPWLSQLDADQTNAMLSYDYTSKILKITGVRNGVQETYIYDRDNNCFMPAEQRSRAGFCMFKGVPYFGSLTNGKLYHDDIGRTNDGIVILHKWSTGRLESDKGRQYMQLRTFEYEGFMSQGCEHALNVYMDGSTTASASFTITDSVITSTAGTPIGLNGIGTDAIGGDAMGALAYPYKVQLIVSGISGEDVKLEWMMNKEGHFLQANTWELQTDLTRFNQRTYQ